jgi:hypothetical protein
MSTARSKSVVIAIIIIVMFGPGFEAFFKGLGPTSEGLGFKEYQARP